VISEYWTRTAFPHRQGGIDPDIDMILNLCLPVAPKIDLHRTAPIVLAGTHMEETRRSHELPTEKKR
jgi:hypothetical protein